MSVEGLILHHGEAHGVTLHQTRIDYLITAEHSKQCSLFEFTVALGFNTGAHYHTKIEEDLFTFSKESSICAVASVPCAAGQELAYLFRLAQRTRSETPVRSQVACC